MAEAVILFSPEKREELAFRRKRAGLLVAKHRLIAAQFDAWLADDLWLGLATRANAMADRLATGLAAHPDTRLPWMPQANEVFVHLAVERAERLTARGARFHDWSIAALDAEDRPRPGEGFYRLVTSFATTEADVDAFLAALGEA